MESNTKPDPFYTPIKYNTRWNTDTRPVTKLLVSVLFCRMFRRAAFENSAARD